MLWHRPWPLHVFVHVLRSHAAPSKRPLSHAHMPVVRSQRPRFEHSARLCATSVALASSDHARA